MATERYFRLAISREEAMKYYRGQATVVRVIADNGQTLQFPALHIRPFINQKGINGLFRIRFDQQHKLQELQRISD